MFFKHFVSKNQLPGFHINGKLVENGLMNTRDPLEKYKQVLVTLAFIGISKNVFSQNLKWGNNNLIYDKNPIIKKIQLNARSI